MNCLETLRKELANVEHILRAVPFTDSCKVDQAHFLNIYELTYEEIIKLNEEGIKFPIDSNKLLKLGISLGNLIKSMQSDEELYIQQKQQQQQRLFMSSLDPKVRTLNASSTNNEPYNPFKDSSSNSFMLSDTKQPTYQIKFIRNLLSILKNFDIGTNYSTNPLNLKLQEVSSNSSNTTLSQYDVSTSPIKLNSNQLLIEKLEINIDLDTLFIYKIVIQLIQRIYTNIEKHLLHIAETSSNNEEIPAYSTNTRLSVFSTNSSNSVPSLDGTDEYFKLLKQAISKITNGLIDPFTRLIIEKIVQPSITGQVNSFVNSLA